MVRNRTSTANLKTNAEEPMDSFMGEDSSWKDGPNWYLPPVAVSDYQYPGMRAFNDGGGNSRMQEYAEKARKERLSMPPNAPRVGVPVSLSPMPMPAMPLPATTEKVTVLNDPNSNFAKQDYQMQLMLLEQQNKKRLEMVRAYDNAPAVITQPVMPYINAPAIATAAGTNSEKLGANGPQDYQIQLMLLEQRQKKERQRMEEWGQELGYKTSANVDRRLGSGGSHQDVAIGATKSKKINIPIRSPTFEVDEGQNPRKVAMENTPEFDTYASNDPSGLLPPVPLWHPSVDEEGKKAKKKKKQKARNGTLQNEDAEPVALPQATAEAASVYCEPFCDFMTDNPTVFHAVDSQKKQLLDLGWTQLDERKKWDVVPGGKYFVERNGSSMIAFSVGEKYKSGNGCAIIAGHVDALTAKLKPISQVQDKAGYVQLGVAPYAGGLNSTWWDRDLGVGGRVLVREDDKIVTKLVKLDWPIARIPTLAPHFGAPAAGPFNLETQMVPIVGLYEHASLPDAVDVRNASVLAGPAHSFANKQPPGLVTAISEALGLQVAESHKIVNWELELFDLQPATTGGLNHEFIFAGRLDDKLCSWAAMQALISDYSSHEIENSSVIKMVGWFDNEEIGSQLKQGAKSNFLPLTIERAVSSLSGGKKGPGLVGRTYANSFLLSSDVTHAVNPNFLNAYLENHAPSLNVGLSVHADPNGHMTTDAVSTAILQRCAESVGAKLQVFQIRNDSRSGGTIGPMLSTKMGMRAIDAGLPQLSMHSIRATTGSLDPGLGVITYLGFLNRFEHVDKEFRD